jgi:tRNA A-37 threonylcarbamoyl transferase component Bud32
MAGDARVGPYRIIRLINRGGQGGVYLGYDKRLQRRVAIKIYTLPPQRQARKRLLHEAQLLASIDSPKVVGIHDVIESSGHLALVMEYIPGCDLEDFLSAVRPSLPSVMTIAVDVAGALAAARQQGIVHGDLKAGNVLIGERGRVKLTDFGIARGTDTEDGGDCRSSGTAGSLSAISPEQYRGEPPQLRSDLFALGCLLYRMLVGEHPFFRDGRLDPRLLLEHVPPPVDQRVSPDVHLPPELVDLVARLLQKNPDDRPGSTRVVRQVLRRVGRSLPFAAGNSLLAEARPCFRQDSAEDIPPAVPSELGRGGRSRLALIGQGRWSLIRGTGRGKKIVAGLLLASVVGAVILAWPTARMRVHIAAPTLGFAGNVELPEAISSRWLVEQVASVVNERLEPIWITGPPGVPPHPVISTREYAGETRPDNADEQLQFGLRCMDMLCVFAVSRNWQGRQVNEQTVLFADMSEQQWRDIVRSTTMALYP